MIGWLVAAAPWVAAVLVYAALAVPLRSRADDARDAYAHARRQRKQAQAELSTLARRAAAWRQVAAAATGASGQAEPGALRRSVLATLEGSGASAVRLVVRPGPRGAIVRVGATAPYAEAVRLAGELARPGTGLILQGVRFRPRTDRSQVTLEVEALAPHVRP